MLRADVLVHVRRTREILAAVPASDQTRGRTGTFVPRLQQIRSENLPTNITPKPAMHNSLVALEAHVTRKFLVAGGTVVPYAAVRDLLVPTEVTTAAESFATRRADEFRTAAIYRYVRSRFMTLLPGLPFYSWRSENAESAQFRTTDLLNYIFYVLCFL